jgi:hypothetical protein
MHQGTIGESDKAKLLEMGFPGSRTDEVKMLKFFESEATAREWCNVWHLHTQSLIADVDPTQVDQDDFTASASTGSSTEACRQRRVMYITMLQASLADMVSSLLATIAKPAIAASVQKLVTSHQGTFSEAKVLAKLRMMWSEIYRLRRVHKHCYEYAQLAVLARLRTWAAVQWQTDFDVSTLFCDRPDPVLSKVLAAFKGPINPLTTLQTAAKEYKEFKTLVTPVLESVKSLKAKNLPDALKAVNEKLKKLEASNEELKRALRRKADKDGGGGGKGGNGGKGGGGNGGDGAKGGGGRPRGNGNGKRKPKGGAAAADADEEKDEE